MRVGGGIIAISRTVLAMACVDCVSRSVDISALRGLESDEAVNLLEETAHSFAGVAASLVLTAERWDVGAFFVEAGVTSPTVPAETVTRRIERIPSLTV